MDEYMVLERMYLLDSGRPGAEIRAVVVVHSRGSFEWVTDQIEHMRRWNQSKGFYGDLWYMPRPRHMMMPVSQKILLEFLSNSGMTNHR